FRVLARYFGIGEPINSTKGKKIFLDIADELLNKDHPGLHNQAMMEFGAMLCKPKNPDCNVCPARAGCYAFNHDAIAVLPQKLKTVKIRERYFNYLVITDGDTILMNKRDEKDIWANMYDLPVIETPGRLTSSEIVTLPQVKDLFEGEIRIMDTHTIKKHVLTHQHLHVQFIRIANRPIKLEQKWFYTNVNNLEKLPLPKIIFIFINNLFNL
ncbi:MAG TPA: NUDIX domain-containing protein, partial [Mucilaginibacter sp.]